VAVLVVAGLAVERVLPRWRDEEAPERMSPAAQQKSPTRWNPNTE